MRKVVSVLALTLALSIAIQPFASRKADAALLVNPVGWSVTMVVAAPLAELLCVMLLPFCLFDEKAPQSSSMSTQDLLANGYTAQEAAMITDNQQKVTQALAQQNKKLVLEKQDDAQAVMKTLDSAGIQGVSEEYAKFLLSFSH